MWNIDNWWRVVVNLLIVAFDVLMGFPAVRTRPLHRKCKRCGQPFIGCKELPLDFDECPECGYNLTGNTSGRCPECGWKLPRRYRLRRKKIAGQR